MLAGSATSLATGTCAGVAWVTWKSPTVSTEAVRWLEVRTVAAQMTRPNVRASFMDVMMPDTRKTGNTGLPAVALAQAGSQVRRLARRSLGEGRSVGLGFLTVAAILTSIPQMAAQARAPQKPTKTYWVYVGAESA